MESFDGFMSASVLVYRNSRPGTGMWGREEIGKLGKAQRTVVLKRAFQEESSEHFSVKFHRLCQVTHTSEFSAKLHSSVALRCVKCFGENAVYFVDNRWGTGTGLPVKTVSGQGFGSLVILIQILILSFAIKETGNERVHPLVKQSRGLKFYFNQ